VEIGPNSTGNYFIVNIYILFICFMLLYSFF